jgi:uncharacterized membrane protein YdbT with pleckstrin-like domain
MEKSETYPYKAITSIIALIATLCTFWIPYNFIIVIVIHIIHMLDRVLVKPESEIQEEQVREVGGSQASSCEKY